MDKLKPFLDVSPEVTRALESGHPVVTLESSDLALGSPYPTNVDMLRKVQATVRENGAVPATIAIIGGQLRIGLTDNEIEYLGRKGHDLRNASRRDIPVLVARGEDGATSVAASIILSTLVGARVFATGGIGGAHRGSPLDISADLEELGCTPLTVVCSGVNPVLDIGATLDCLKTRGIPVLGYRTEAMPAFFVRDSGHRVDYQVDSPEEAARIFEAKECIGLRGGILIVNPIPWEDALDEEQVNDTIEDAVESATRRGIQGKELTSLLLEQLRCAIGGKIPLANTSLMCQNARLAAKVAREVCLL